MKFPTYEEMGEYIKKDDVINLFCSTPEGYDCLSSFAEKFNALQTYTFSNSAENKVGLTLRTKSEQRAYLDGYEMCGECIEKYLSDEGKQKLECLISSVRNAVEIEDIFTDKPEFEKVMDDIHANKGKEVVIVSESDNKSEWILDETDNSVTCEKCGCSLYPNDISNGDPHFCPNCGADMKGE